MQNPTSGEMSRRDLTQALGVLGILGASTVFGQEGERRGIDAAKFEFRPAYDAWAPGRVLVQKDEERFYVGDERLEPAQIQWLGHEPGTDRDRTLSFVLTEEGAAVMRQMTRPERTGQPLLVFYEGRLLMAPVIRGQIAERGQLSFSSRELQQLLREAGV